MGKGQKAIVEAAGLNVLFLDSCGAECSVSPYQDSEGCCFSKRSLCRVIWSPDGFHCLVGEEKMNTRMLILMNTRIACH
ncbi:hypothetical protein L1987_78252 [Smallanthus sonchifolius]|uniref:Uncharacterized protein n=1 Tax=Smallanthus sonchifolius TaxID=185202 RepID=A0ACB8ZCD7_9ASTR|nr:hypothetical protein L1987_78252 [Smallanthus sonchifolius]